MIQLKSCCFGLKELVIPKWKVVKIPTYLSDEEVEQEDEFHHMYSSLPPTQILERAAQVVDDQPSSSGGLDMMGGLKFMLRSRSFLLRPPFHKKNSAGRSRSRGSDSPFR